jgi:hypothetical protein
LSDCGVRGNGFVHGPYRQIPRGNQGCKGNSRIVQATMTLGQGFRKRKALR